MGRRSIYHGVLVLLLAAFFLMGVGAWNFQAGHLMVVIFLVLSGVLYGIFALLARCPRCRSPVLLRPCRVLGIEFYLWSIVMPRRCRHCGKALT